jgi:G3E family GTPase
MVPLQAFDCCVIESTGISLPMPVAATFAFLEEGEGEKEEEGEAGDQSSSPAKADAVAESGAIDAATSSSSSSSQPAQVAQLDTLVTVVDGQRFVSDVLTAESLAERQLQADEEDERTVADLLVEQVRQDMPGRGDAPCEGR